MIARLGSLALACLLFGGMLGCGGDTRRAETETGGPPVPASSLTTSERSNPGAVRVTRVTDPARRAYIAKVDSVCGRMDSARGKEQERVGSAADPEEATRAYEGTIRLGWRELRQIEAIGLPPGEATVLQANVFDQIKRQLALRRKIKAALAVVNVPKLERLRIELDNSARALTGFARGYGFRVCGEA